MSPALTMRRWVLATRTRYCGGCHATPVAIPKGTPMLEIQLLQVRDVLVRCPACAGVPLPESLQDTSASLTDTSPARLVPDWPWLRRAPPPASAAHLDSVAERWSPFRDGDDDDQP